MSQIKEDNVVEKSGSKVAADANGRLTFPLSTDPGLGKTLTLRTPIGSNQKPVQMFGSGNRLIVGEDQVLLEPHTEFGIIEFDCQPCTLFLNIESLDAPQKKRPVKVHVLESENAQRKRTLTIVID